MIFFLSMSGVSSWSNWHSRAIIFSILTQTIQRLYLSDQWQEKTALCSELLFRQKCFQLVLENTDVHHNSGHW